MSSRTPSRRTRGWRWASSSVVWLLGAAAGLTGGGQARVEGSAAPPVLLLESGTITESLTGGQTLVLEAGLYSSTYMRLSIEASGLELQVKHLAPDGREVIRSRIRGSRPASLSLVSKQAGTHRIELQSLDDVDQVGSVHISVTERREARASDQDRAAADGLFYAAEELRWGHQQRIAEAIEKYTRAFETWRTLSDYRQAAVASERIGAVHQQIGELQQALAYYRDALMLSQKEGDRDLESEMESAVGLTHVLLGELKQGFSHCRRALALAQDSARARSEAIALTCLGEVAYYSGRLVKALALQHRAEAVWDDAGDRWGLAQIKLYLGYSYLGLSEFSQASGWQQEALALARLIGDQRTEISSLIGLGRIHELLGEYQAALNSFTAAIQLIEPAGDPMWQASALAGLASVHDRIGEKRRAAEYWEEALEFSRRAGVPVAEADMLQAVGEMHLTAGDADRALALFRQSLEISEDQSHSRLTASALRFIGLAYQSKDQPREALKYYEQSLAAQRPEEDTRFEAYTLGDMGRAYESLGDYDRAVEFFTSAIELSRSVKDLLGQAMELYSLARVTRAQGDLPLARQHIEASLQIVESLRSGVASHELRASYLASVHQYYELQVDILMALHRDRPAAGLAAEAFLASERSRARSLLDSLLEAGVDIRRGADPTLLANEQRVKRALEGKTGRLMRVLSTDSDRQEVAALDEQISELSAEYEQLQAEIRSKSPHYAALTQPEPIGVKDIQELVLDDRTLLLEYALGDERSFLWVVSSREYASYELPSRDEIEQSARNVYGLLTARLPVAGEGRAGYRQRVEEADGRYWGESLQLSETLLGPVADRIEGMRLLIVADGALQYLPFAALPVPRDGKNEIPMVIEHEMVSLPSASTLAILRQETAGRPASPKSVAVLADPVFELDDPRLPAAMGTSDSNTDLPPSTVDRSSGSGVQRALGLGGPLQEEQPSVPRLAATRHEANAIVAVATEEKSQKFVDFAANRDNARSPELASYRIIHFATHGLVNSENPGLSGILLSMFDEKGKSQNGFLGLHDIYNLHLPVELVVLSACNTALGKEVRGEGLVGIVRGFMYAGSKRVVASLWKVEDEATKELMSRFYQQMLREERSPAAALRQAQIEMWHEEPWRPPFFWAAFILQGEWR